jgi:hypothetical protein
VLEGDTSGVHLYSFMVRHCDFGRLESRRCNHRVKKKPAMVNAIAASAHICAVHDIECQE